MVPEILEPDPAPRGTVKVQEALVQDAAWDTAPRKQPFLCQLGVSVLGGSPSALGHGPMQPGVQLL